MKRIKRRNFFRILNLFHYNTIQYNHHHNIIIIIIKTKIGLFLCNIVYSIYIIIKYIENNSNNNNNPITIWE
jgi:hypothetical protein